MIDPVLALCRLALGLGAVVLLGYGCFALLVPNPREFLRLEKLALGFGIGVTLLTLWMLVFSWLGLKLSLPMILVPPLALSGVALLVKMRFRSGGQRAVSGETPAPPVPSSSRRSWDWVLLGLLSLLFLYATFRAMLYPMWAWDAIATWGCKAKVFYQS